MAKIYGHKWVSSYGEADDGSWGKGLAGITPEQIGVGLDQILKDGESWPPSLPEFRMMCEGRKENGFGLSYTPECYRVKNETDQKKLANPATEVTRKAALTELKQILGSK